MLDIPAWHGWTPEAVDLLRKLYAEAKSFGDIARAIRAQFGDALNPSRNSVISKAHRSLGLVGRPPSYGISQEMQAAREQARHQRELERRQKMLAKPKKTPIE